MDRTCFQTPCTRLVVGLTKTEATTTTTKHETGAKPEYKAIPENEVVHLERLAGVEEVARRLDAFKHDLVVDLHLHHTASIVYLLYYVIS